MSPVSIDWAEACTEQGKPLGVPTLPLLLRYLHAVPERIPRIFQNVKE